ncbi:ubiquinone anaerobic biosynthesis protein UbiV [Bradyrhizobium canariense]|uniref:Ubiquinone biosynthesis protein UbiV n=1 Tax=Bradyrhizobium canariense TaxID=255045 RepID=A0A1H2BFK4_9BRAD|nr:U32 family peptidase [Bradyrhizobium canariense]SDT57033.1 Collagenase-like protease, PrtC family [Bradyrhizobium canariense]
MKLTLGPILFNWEPDVWRDFYFRIADEAAVDAVAVGEVVCSKRMPFFDVHLPAVVERLTAAGKQVLMSSLALITLERERRHTEELARDHSFLVEANDISCIAHLAGRPHVTGPFVNVYNEGTARWFAAQGARRICLPPELPLESIAAVAAATPQVEIEVFAFGRAPLAISARCYHARLHKLSKDNCRFVCAGDADGLPVDTLDDERFLVINGVQTLAYACTNLIADTDDLVKAGVASLRLSPQHCDMVAVARTFRDVLDGRVVPEEGMRRLNAIYPNVSSTNGFLRGRPAAP